MKLKRKILLLFVINLMILGLSACGANKTDNKNKDNQTFATNAKDVISTMDSSLNSTIIGSQQLKNTMEGLYRFNGNKVVPGVANKVVKPTNKGKRYIFHLRKSNWSNGDPVTASDFVYAWRRIVNPKTGSSFSYAYSGIKNADQISSGKMNPDQLGVKALDDYTLEVNLDHPISYFNELIVSSRFLPLNQKAVEKAGDKYGTNSENVVYNGPFKLVNWKIGDTSWKEVKNDQYWNVDKVKLNTLKYNVVKDPNTGINLYQTNKIDRYGDLSGDTALQLKNKKDFVTNPSQAMYYLQLNQKDNPLFKNKKIRQAISHSIDRNQLAENILGNTVKPASSVVPSQTIFNKRTNRDFKQEKSSVNDLQYTKYNPALAKKLWQAGLKESGIKNPSLSLVTDDQDSSKKISEYLQSVLTSNLNGLKIDVSNVPFKNRLQKGNSGDFDIILWGWIPDYPDPSTTLDLFTTNNSMNTGKWSNSEYDKLQKLSSITDANNYQKRWDDLLKQQHILTKEQGVIPLYQNKIAALMKNNVKNYRPSPDGLFDMVDVYKK